jgi:hypothetical protein
MLSSEGTPPSGDWSPTRREVDPEYLAAHRPVSPWADPGCVRLERAYSPNPTRPRICRPPLPVATRRFLVVDEEAGTFLGCGVFLRSRPSA